LVFNFSLGTKVPTRIVRRAVPCAIRKKISNFET
jgi:hypothetical protein